MINAEERGVAALSTSTATAIYEGQVRAPSHPTGTQGVEIFLLPFRSQGQWRLGVADIPRAILYYLAFDGGIRWPRPPPWIPERHLLTWLQTLTLQPWTQTNWAGPHPSRGPTDSGVAAIAAMIRVTRGAGLPTPSTFAACLPNIRGGIAVGILFLTLSPPPFLLAGAGLAATLAPWRERRDHRLGPTVPGGGGSHPGPPSPGAPLTPLGGGAPPAQPLVRGNGRIPPGGPSDYGYPRLDNGGGA